MLSSLGFHWYQQNLKEFGAFLQHARRGYNIWNKCPIPTMSHLQLLILKFFLDEKKKGENLSTAKGLFIIFPLQIAATLWLCLLKPLTFFFPFAWWHSLSSVVGNIIHSVCIHGTSFSYKYETKKFCKNTITICRGGKAIFVSQEGERTECVQSAGPTGAERRIPLRNSILARIISRQLIFQELKR